MENTRVFKIDLSPKRPKRCGGCGSEHKLEYTNWKGTRLPWREHKSVTITVDLMGWTCACGESMVNGSDCRLIDVAIQESLRLQNVQRVQHQA